MSTMDADPGHLAENNTHSGKRKRSPGISLSPPEHSQCSDSGSNQKNEAVTSTSKELLKKPRVGSTPPDMVTSRSRTLFPEQARSFPLPPFPMDILQHIMSFLDPFSLGRLMRVNRYLTDLLGSKLDLEPGRSPGTCLSIQTAEGLWKSSRETYLPSLPHPLKQSTELDMLKLIYGTRCVACSMPSPTPSSKVLTTPWNSGPGPSGVRTIWPFRTKLCANCLRPLLLKETEIVQSGVSPLTVGLLPTFFTPSLHYVMLITMAQTPRPQGLNITKYYFRPQVEDFVHNNPDVFKLEGAASEALLQRLNLQREQNLSDTCRLEAWELSLKVQNDLLAVPFNMNSRSSASGSSVHSDNLTKSHLTASSGRYRPALSSRSGFGSSVISGSLSGHNIGMPSLLHRTEVVLNEAPPNIPSSAPRLPQQNNTIPPEYSNPSQSSFNIARLKAEKRMEIQTRCQQLERPIEPSLLERLPAFQSAISNLIPLDDHSWEKLIIELVNQCHAIIPPEPIVDAPALYSNAVAPSSTVWRAPTPVAEPAEQDPIEQAQRPTKDRITEFAREYVHRQYAGGLSLSYGTAPQFAADVLLYARQRFYHNQAEEDAAIAAQGGQPPDEGPSGIRTRTLRLEHMRHVFEQAIKPYTEHVRKDLFLCAACDTQGRHFAFEAIIQHYASKHTDDFSRGAAVVHWKAEWPADPPFEPAPGRDLDPTPSVVFPPQPPPQSTLTQALESNNTATDPDQDHYQVGRRASQHNICAHRSGLNTPDWPLDTSGGGYERSPYREEISSPHSSVTPASRLDPEQTRRHYENTRDHHGGYQRSPDFGIQEWSTQRATYPSSTYLSNASAISESDHIAVAALPLSRESSTIHHLQNTDLRHDSSARPSNHPVHGAAEHFLDTIDITRLGNANKTASVPLPAAYSRRSLPVDEVQATERNPDYRTSISQPRRPTRILSRPGGVQNLMEESAPITRFRDSHDSRADWSNRSEYGEHQRHEQEYSRNTPPFNPRENRITIHSDPNIVHHEQLHFSRDSRRNHEDRYDPPQTRYLDQYGREVYPSDYDGRYNVQPRYHEVRYERINSPREVVSTEAYHVRGQSEPLEDIEIRGERRYYRERAAREYLPDSRLNDQEHVPVREVIYQDDPRSHRVTSHQGSARDDQRYERRY